MGGGFWALFATQFLGAFNDNLFKTTLTVTITFSSVSFAGLPPTALVALAGALLILPFALFSALAGQLADRFPKDRLIALTKLGECLIMVLGGAGLVWGSMSLCLGALFLLGTQSAFFGPLKYGALPELLKPHQLVKGNAYVEMGTFLAILLGTIAGGVLSSRPSGEGAGVGVAVAVVGFLAARRVPALPPADPHLRVELGWFRPTWQLVGIGRQNRAVFHSILGISWFWLLGAVVLSVLPELVRAHWGGGPGVVTFALGAFSIGVGLGALLCEKLSFEQIELGLVPFGALGLTLFLALLGFVSAPLAAHPGALGVAAFLGEPRGVGATVAVVLLAVSGGVFTVPLYTLLQGRSEPGTRSRVVAANNVLNAVFMVVGSAVLALLSSAGMSTPQVLLVLAIVNVGVAVYTYSVVPEFMFRLVCWVLAHVVYKLEIQGRDRIPKVGAAVLVCNHVTFVDWLILSAATQRPIRFVMHYEFLALPLTGRLFRDAKVIPIASAKENPEVLEAAFGSIREALAEGELVCIFPEGRLTRDGRLSPFRRGIERIVEGAPVPVIPLGLHGLWGSWFSRYGKGPLRRRFGHLRQPVSLMVGAPLAPDGVTVEAVERSVVALLPPPSPEAAPAGSAASVTAKRGGAR
ncbi:MAG: putative phospholipid/glycerol acyltransferase [Polyangiaceae bacterium]|nr:putative phospholipid/glycerol acyltransferase [Polyangiaceae bacterium]